MHSVDDLVVSDEAKEIGSAQAWWKTFGWLTLVWFAALLGAWELLARAQAIDPFVAPPPSRLVAALWELVTEGFPTGTNLVVHLGASLGRIAIGYLIATSLAIPLGILIGWSRTLDALTHKLLTLGRSTAAISILPLFIAWFGIGEASKVAVIAFGCFWITITHTIAGVKLVDPLLIRAARALDTSTRRLFFTVILPASLPRVFSGLKISLGIAFMVIVAAEMIATETGMGSLIQEARTYFRTEITMVGMLVIGAIGFLASKALDVLEHRLLPWIPAIRENYEKR